MRNLSPSTFRFSSAVTILLGCFFNIYNHFFQCKEIEENNRMGKTRDLFKKIRDTRGTFHATATATAKSLQSCPTLCDPMDCSPAGSSCPWDSPGKNNGMGCHAFLQGVFLTQGSNPRLLDLLQIKPMSLRSPALTGRFFTTSATWEAQGQYI